MKHLFLSVSVIAAIAAMTGCMAAPLYSAAAGGDNKAITDLLRKGADVNATQMGSSPLHAAAVNGRLDTVRLLLDGGAELDKKRIGGSTPLMDASSAGHVGVAKLLIERGADTAYAIAEFVNISNRYIGSTRAEAQRGIQVIEGLIADRGPSSGGVGASGTIKEAPAIQKAMSDVDDLPVVKVRSRNNAYAIVIGIESYRQKLPKADFADADAKTMSAYLTKVLGYPEENVVLLVNDRALKSDLEKYIEKWLSNKVDGDSTVFVYYSGHGAPNPRTGDAFLVPFDGDPSFIDQTGYSLKRMYDALGKLPAKEIIVALDSCFSGAGGRSVLAKGARPLVMNLNTAAPARNMTVLAASSGEQISSTYDEKGHGLFTYFFLKGIRNENVVDQNGSLNVAELYRYVKPQVEIVARNKYNNEQTPQLIEGKR